MSWPGRGPQSGVMYFLIRKLVRYLKRRKQQRS